MDSHLHLNLKGLGEKQLISYMDEEMVDQCWLLTWDEMEPRLTDYVHLAVEDVFELYYKYPSRVVPMYAPDPERPDAVERFRAWLDRGVRGCGELKAPLAWDSPRLEPLLSLLDGLGLPLVFHMEAGGQRFRPAGSSLELAFARFMNSPRVGELAKRILEAMTEAVGPVKRRKDGMRFYFPGYLMDFAALENRLIEYPGIKFIGHGPTFWKGICSSADLCSPAVPKGPVKGEGIVCRLLSGYDNLYADISAQSGYDALARDTRFAVKFLSEFSGKLLYGTDNFFLGLRQMLDSLNLSRQCYRRIYGENACGLLTPAPEAARCGGAA